MHSDPATAGFGWIQDSVESCIQCGYSWIQDTAGYAAFSCVRVQLRSAWIQVCVQLRSGTCVQLRSAFGCVLRSAAFCVLRSAAFCVQLRSRSAAFCVQLRSAFCVQLRSAFGCVLRSAAFRNLRSAAFCVQLRSAWIQPGAIQSFWVGILCRQGRQAWTHMCCNPSLAARTVNTHAFLPGPDLCPSTNTNNTKTPNEYMPG